MKRIHSICALLAVTFVVLSSPACIILSNDDPDTSIDTSIDTAVDTAVDTGDDTTVDTGTDTGEDTAVDTAVDTVADVPVDTVEDDVVGPPFWSGTDSSIQFDWTIDTLAVTPTICAMAGGATVRMSVASATGVYQWYDDLVWDCEAGHADTGLTFAAGTYWIAWELVDGSSGSISLTDTYEYSLVAGANDLADIDFVTATGTEADVLWYWTIEGHAWDDTLYAGLCPWSTGDVTTIQLMVDTDLDSTADDLWDAECLWGAAMVEGTDSGYSSGQTIWYAFQLVDSGGYVWSSSDTWIPITLGAGINDLGEVDFDLGDYGPLDVTLQWANAMSSPTYGDCAHPPEDVSIMGYLLRYSDASIADVMDIDTDLMACTTDLAWIETDFDNYSLVLDGEDYWGTYMWGSTCIDLLVDDEVSNEFSCQVFMTDSP